MDVAERIQQDNEVWADTHETGHLIATPGRHLAVVTCMDARLEVLSALGLRTGEAHVVRNAGGVITDDVLRSLALSQRKLGTVDVVVVQHTECGLKGFDDQAFRQVLGHETGVAPGWDVPGFDDVDASVRLQVQAVLDCPWLSADGLVAGFVYDVGSDRLRLVCRSSNRPT